MTGRNISYLLSETIMYNSVNTYKHFAFRPLVANKQTTGLALRELPGGRPISRLLQSEGQLI